MSGKLKVDVLRVGSLDTNCYFLQDEARPEEILLVDPGDQPESILNKAETLGGKVTAIFLTHGHYDHILAVNRIREAMPEVKLYISEAEKPMVENPGLNCNSCRTEYHLEPDVYVRDGDVLELIGHRFRVISSPGHTAGSCCYYDGEDGVLFAGDTIFFEGCGRTDLPTGSTKQMIASLRMLLTELPEKTVIFPGHGPETTAAHEREVEDYLFRLPGEMV